MMKIFEDKDYVLLCQNWYDTFLSGVLYLETEDRYFYFEIDNWNWYIYKLFSLDCENGKKVLEIAKNHLSTVDRTKFGWYHVDIPDELTHNKDDNWNWECLKSEYIHVGYIMPDWRVYIDMNIFNDNRENPIKS